MIDNDEYLSPKELADRAGVSVALIRRCMKEGELEYVEHSPKNRKIKYSSWLDYVARRTHPVK